MREILWMWWQAYSGIVGLVVVPPTIAVGTYRFLTRPRRRR